MGAYVHSAVATVISSHNALGEQSIFDDCESVSGDLEVCTAFVLA